MKRFIFISYSDKDRVFADSVLNYIENQIGIPCWIAYRDILGGSNYAESIKIAISECACFILLHSENSQSSEHIKNELELAMEEKKVVIPCKLDNVHPEGQFDYYLKNKHWLDIKDSQKENFEVLRRSIISVLGSKFKKSAQSINDILSNIANNGATPESIQELINETHHLCRETYEGKKNRPLNKIYDAIIDDIKIIQESKIPDYTNLSEHLDGLWDVIRKILNSIDD